MMHQFSIIFSVLSIFVLSVLAAPLPFDQLFSKRDTFYGQATWFYDGLGACGYTNTNSDPIVAISSQIYGTGANCGQWVSVTNTDNGQSAYGLTHDECQSCASGDLDLSEGLFEQLGPLSDGVLPITWEFMPVGWSPS